MGLPWRSGRRPRSVGTECPVSGMPQRVVVVLVVDLVSGMPQRVVVVLVVDLVSGMPQRVVVVLVVDLVSGMR